MNVLICLSQEDIPDNKYSQALKMHFGEESQHYHLLPTRSALPDSTLIDFSSFFEKLENDDELDGTLNISEDYAPVYDPLRDQLVYQVSLGEDFNISVKTFLRWIKMAWNTDSGNLVHPR